ncbi:MAG: hypothetical protein HYT43_01745, partial [Candidatus Taylorbacteria bacterium]|nr:hypothetical protein [Candidatus Taylorbacteria bacterium]
MKLTIEQILKRLGRNAVLRPGEKESLRTFLLGHIHSRPPAPAAHSFSFFSFFFSRGLAAAAVFLAVLGSVAAGAERALPGSPLYGVKISLNENVRGWFALS